MQWKLRRSQFVFTWGPGSLLEGGFRGSRLILRPDHGLFHPLNLAPERFRIGGLRVEGLLRALLKQSSPGGEAIRVFRLPSNAELGKADSEPLYRTMPFPRWRLCRNTGRHRNGKPVLFEGVSHTSSGFKVKNCPVCQNGDFSEPVRFVMACPGGHLDDVDWHRVVHNSGSCKPGYYLWEGGGSLSQIWIRCPKCRKSASLGEAYGKNWPCSGWFPESDPRRENLQSCSIHARILLRQASYLRIPEILTLFTIPPLHRELHKLVEKHRENVELLDDLVKEGDITANQAESRIRKRYPEFSKYSWDDIRRALEDLVREEQRFPAQSPEDSVLDEFHTFLKGTESGIPRDEAEEKDTLIEMRPARKAEIRHDDSILSFRVSRLPVLQTVSVQIGYRREIRGADVTTGASGFVSTRVDVSFQHNGARWYPGVVFTGEGIFITLDSGGWREWNRGENSSGWFEAFRNPEIHGVDRAIQQEILKENVLHPAFVWWHTLSHALIRTIAGESGYPAASIRERVYVEVDEDNPGRARGGVLLYTAQPGTDGTLGGLIALVPRFESILYRAFDLLDSCSLDPICGDTRFEKGRYSGAACYACQFLSETSCEHRNMWLDRGVIREHLQ